MTNDWHRSHQKSSDDRDELDFLVGVLALSSSGSGFGSDLTAKTAAAGAAAAGADSTSSCLTTAAAGKATAGGAAGVAAV